MWKKIKQFIMNKEKEKKEDEKIKTIEYENKIIRVNTQKILENLDFRSFTLEFDDLFLIEICSGIVLADFGDIRFIEHIETGDESKEFYLIRQAFVRQLHPFFNECFEIKTITKETERE